MTLLAFSAGGTAQAQRDGFITFDRGQDGAVISIPGLALSGASGESWLYGDVRTRQYNAPHPDDCSDRPGVTARPVCEYAVSGTGFAWLGQLGREGRIEFTQGTATYVEASFATAEALQITAYAPGGRVVGAATVAPNRGTGSLGLARIDAPAGAAIAYLIIRGSPNFWLLDNFATDAPGVPNELPDETPDPAFVVVTQALRLGSDPELGRLATYTLQIVNRGPGNASEATISFPFAPAELRVVDASFSRPGAWVAALRSDALTIRSGALPRQGGSVTAVVRFQLLREPPPETALGARLFFTWIDSATGGRGRSNLPVMSTTPADQPLQTALDVSPARGPAGTTHSFSTRLLAPNEPVALWHSSARGEVEIGRVSADADGTTQISFRSTGLAPGSYTLVAYGVWSGITASASFEVSD